MTAEGAKATLARAAKRAWPNVAKASELPFPEFWKSVSAWLEFHASRLSDKLIYSFVADAVQEAKDAEARGARPKPWKAPGQGSRGAEAENRDGGMP